MNRTMTVVSILVLGFLVVANISISFCTGNSHVGCIESEKQALLKFKQHLIDPSNRLASWSDDGDCCMWVGVVCHNLTGHVRGVHLRNVDYEAYEKSKLSGTISPSLLDLKHLSSLDLSENDFGGIQIPKFFGSMRSLRYLNLSRAGFGGMIPHQLGNLSNLCYLDLQNSYHYHDLNVKSFQWLFGLSSLQHLDMSYVNLGKASDWLQVTNSLPCLVELHLSGCQLQNVHLLHNVNFSSLARLDLSDNYFGDSFFPRWVFSLNMLVSLDLRGNNFQGPIPSGFQNISSLKYLDLSSNNFNASIPYGLYSFHSLEFLNLHQNMLQGKISSAIENLTSVVSLDLSLNEFEGGIPISLGKRLELLDLSANNFSGQLTDQLGQFKKLTQLDLSRNSISGPIPVSIGKLSSLRELDLSYNDLNGTLPKSIGQLSKLEFLNIFENRLKGVVSEAHFANLTRLMFLDASGNSLILRVSHFWVPPFQISSLGLGSWHLGPRFPLWLRSQKYIIAMDLSNARLLDTIPTWFWNMSSQFIHLNLSHNQIHGEFPYIIRITYSSFPVIDLNSNHFEGPLPYFSSNVSGLDLSNNFLSGSISHFLCHQINEPNYMTTLNLGGNNLSGELPNCWMRWKNLWVINLSDNSFNGNIPSSMGTLSSLESLHLRNNRFFGELPLSLSNCTNLVTIDFGGNELAGIIPSWIGERLLSLRTLNLRSNKFYGHIPDELCALTSLQVLDLANNSLFGAIPRCIHNFSAMVTKDSPYDYAFLSGSYADEIVEVVLLVMKGQVAEYSTILRYVKVLDLSDNKLSGEMPREVTSLQGLQSLNLSNNLLTGRIPQNIGAMNSLESVDLSVNQFSGEIPSSMSSLTFLSRLNLSYNNLRGKIPSSTQLQSFDPSSFIGNELCGLPLTHNCSVNGAIPNNTERVGGKLDNGLEVDWFYVSMALGFVVGFSGAVGSLLFNRPWRIVFFQFMDRMWLTFGGFINKCN